MKKGMYKILVSISCFCLCMSFFIVPVKAEDSIYYPDPDSYSAYDYFFRKGYKHLMLSSTNNVTYNVNLDQYGSNDGTVSGQEHTTGTINSNGSSTLGSKYMTCTTNNGTSASQTYSCYFSSTSYGVSNNQSINIGFNENTYTSVNNTIDQTINTDITGTIKASTGSYDYAYLPWLNGTYTHTTAYDFNNSIIISTTDTKFKNYYLIFATSSQITYNADGQTLYPSSNAISGEIKYSYLFQSPTFCINIVRITALSGHGRVSFDLTTLNSSSVLPLYCGFEYQMPDDIAQLIGLRKSIGTILNSGNDNTNQSISDANNANNQVSQKINQFDSIENDSVNDMSSKINNLNVTPDIIANSKFISSAAWVKTQFDHMTIGTPIGSVLAFSLLLGVALIFVGKYR